MSAATDAILDRLTTLHPKVIDLSLDRLTALLAELATAPADHLVLVTHGDTLRVALAVLAGRTHRQLDWHLAIDNGSVHTTELDPAAAALSG